jgi:hypothetical protein
VYVVIQLHESQYEERNSFFPNTSFSLFIFSRKEQTRIRR